MTGMTMTSHAGSTSSGRSWRVSVRGGSSSAFRAHKPADTFDDRQFRRGDQHLLLKVWVRGPISALLTWSNFGIIFIARLFQRMMLAKEQRPFDISLTGDIGYDS